MRFFWLAPVVAAGLATPASAQGRYQFTPKSVLETRGDTVHWYRTVASARVDTSVYVIRKDSTVRLLRPGPARELPEPAAKHFRNLLNEAKASTDLQRRMQLIKP